MRCPRFSSRQNLTNVAWAYSHLNVGGEDLLAEVARIAHARIHEMRLGGAWNTVLAHGHRMTMGLGRPIGK